MPTINKKALVQEEGDTYKEIEIFLKKNDKKQKGITIFF